MNKELKDFEKLELGDFKPFSSYDKSMDCIRVYSHDASITEERIDEYLTVYKPNHTQDHNCEYVGFCLKGVYSHIKSSQVRLELNLSLADHFDKKVKDNLNYVNEFVCELTDSKD